MKNRVVGLDLVRTIAIIFVFSLHFLLNSGYYDLQYNSISSFVLTIFHWLVITCISLFLILTGYLNKSKILNKKYFLKILKVIVSYLLISIICVIFRKVYLNEDLSILESIKYILNYEACGYAWYVEMYIGLFILIPFLNILYDVIENKKKLILVFLLLGIIPQSFRLFIPEPLGFNIIPDSWTAIYPLSFFFIGRYLRDYPLNISFIKKILILIASLLLESILCYFMYYNKNYPGKWFDFGIMAYNNAFTMIIAVMIFSLCTSYKIKNKIVHKLLNLISLFSFEMYLISWMSDKFIYSFIKIHYNSLIDVMVNYCFYVGFVFILSFDIAIVINSITKWIVSKINKKGVKNEECKCNSTCV